jgi:hypothetical protein
VTNLKSSGNLFDQEIELLLNRKTGLSSLWTQGVTGDEKEKRVQTLMNSGYQFDLLRDILESMYRKAALDAEQIDSPYWKDRAAFQLGYKKALRDIYHIIPQTKEK